MLYGQIIAHQTAPHGGAAGPHGYDAGVFRYLLRVSLSQIGRYRAQSALVILGVAIGIANIIVLISMTDLGRRQTVNLINDFGANVLIITPFIDLSSGAISLFSQANNSGYIDNEVYEALLDSEVLAPREGAPEDAQEQRQVSALLQLGAHVSRGEETWFTTAAGATPQVQDFGDLDLDTGRWITEADCENATTVAVLAVTAAAELFGDADPVGQTIMIKEREFTVVGLLRPKGSMGMEEADNRIYVPLCTLQELFEFPGIHGILARYRRGLREDDAVAQVKRELAAALPEGAAIEDEVSVFTAKEATKLMDSTLGIFRAVLIGVASIALLVAGIGIMNVMLIRVLRRRMEIGLRRAVGASRRVIVAQFLVESTLQAMLGAAAGIAVGCVGLAVFCDYADWEFYLSPTTVLMAVLFALGVGVAFGCYPAWRAARVDPIASLRHEM
jgi:putative ABC transport system permease protein